MKYISDFKKSKTIKSARLKQLSGLITIILANINYFESSLTPAIFGTVLIVFGFVDEYLRNITTQPMSEK